MATSKLIFHGDSTYFYFVPCGAGQKRSALPFQWELRTEKEDLKKRLSFKNDRLLGQGKSIARRAPIVAEGL